MLKGRGQAIDVDPLPVEIAVAEIVAVIGLRERPVVDLIEEIGNAIDGNMVVALMDIGQGQAGWPANADGERGRDSPAMIIFEVAARNVVAMEHGVEPNRDQVAEPLI